MREANTLVAGLGGYHRRAKDGPPGAETLGQGLRRLLDLTRGWRLRGENSTEQKEK